MQALFVLVRPFYTILMVLALAGCKTAPRPVEHDIPNFRHVAAGAGIYRGGQPKSAAGWAYLQSLGVSNVVKLNLESEVSDEGARALGMTVCYFPINQMHQILLKPDREVVLSAVGAIKPGTYVHCTEGRDRTGLIIGCKRVWQDGWTQADAWKEMRAGGFRSVLRGLTGFWDEAVHDQRLIAEARERGRQVEPERTGDSASASPVPHGPGTGTAPAAGVPRS